jgi:hypothetical protein
MSKAEYRYLEHFLDGKLRNCSSKDAFLYGYHQAKKDVLSEYGWLVSKVKILKLKYCHNREAVKAIEEACNILNEFG